MSAHTSLDAASTERKARLAKLKSLKRKEPSDDDGTHDRTGTETSTTEPDIDVTKQYLSGRNYDAESKAPKLGFENAPSADKSTLEIRAKEIADTTKAAADAEAQDDKGIDLFKLQPKKPNWDLKRDLAKKMEILNVRTDNAIAKMVQERIAAQKKAQKDKANGGTAAADDDEPEGSEVLGLKGEELVEGIHQREREEQEDERRDEEDEDL